MSETHKVIRVFVASPGGLEEERKAVSDVIEEINRRNSSHWNMQFKAVGWEDTIGGNRRPQSLINRDLETCDYFVGILADHWGSPPQPEGSSETTYTSGFHEEYEVAQQLAERGSMLDVFLFFKELPSERVRDAGPSLKRVIEFRQKIRDARKPFYYEFADTNAFVRKVGDTLTEIGWRSLSVQAPEPEATAPSQKLPVTETATDRVAKDAKNERFHVTGGARTFLKDLLDRERGDEDAISATDVARLRLVAAAEYRSGNDTVRVGVHDANILFRDRHRLDLTGGEKYALLAAGLKYMEHKNVPFWVWTDGNAHQVKQIIQSWMGFSEGEEHLSAIKLGTALGYDVPDYDLENGRNAVLRSWFVDSPGYPLEQAMTEYLIKLGKPEDIETLDGIAEKKSGQRPVNIANIAIAIRLRQSTEVGIAELLKRDPEQIDDILLQSLSSAFEGLSSGDLLPVTKLKSEGVRLKAVQELRRRQALTQQLAEELSADSSYDVRLEALLALADFGAELPENRVKLILVKPSQHRGTGLGAFFMPTRNDSSRFEVFQKYLLRCKSLDELRNMDEEHSVPHDSDAFLAACEAYPRQMHQRLREALEDGFHARFDEKMQRLRGAGLNSEKDLNETLELRDFSCLRQTQAGLDVLASQMRGSDLSTVRHVVDSWEIASSALLLKFFERFGEWSDIDRILKLKTPTSAHGTILSLGRASEQHDALVGKCLYQLGRHRIVDLFSKVDGSLKTHVVKHSAKLIISGLSDSILLKLMNDKNDGLRNMACLRCLETLPKSRISRLLEQYTEQDAYRYYSTIHWLDLGDSMQKDVVLRIVRHELQGRSR